MRWAPQPPLAQIPHLQPQQPQGLPAACWPPCPPQHVTYNPFTEPQYPGMMSMLSPPQSMPPVPAFGEQTPSFQTLVAAVSRSIQDDERSVPIDVIDMDPEEMSSEDERALIEALKKWKGGELRMPEVFEALSKTNGHTETEWKTWFITNFEKLNSKVDLTPTTQQRVSAGGTPATAFGGNGTSRNRPGAKRQPSRSSATRRMDEHPRSRIAPASVPQDLGGNVHRSPSCDRCHVSNSSAPRAASARRRSRHVTENSGTKTTSKWTRVPSRAGEHSCPVTPEDLRAMARYLFEKGDDDPDTLRRYNSARWREFAARPENHKRTLDGWACIPRLHPKHAAEIERYLKGFQKDADAAKSSGGSGLENAADPEHVAGSLETSWKGSSSVKSK